MNDFDEHFFDRLVVNDEKARRALAYVKEHLGGPCNLEFLKNLAVLYSDTRSPVLLDLTIGFAVRLQFTLMDLAARCSNRAQEVRERTAENHSRALESMKLIAPLLGQVITCGRIMLEADSPPKRTRRGRG